MATEINDIVGGRGYGFLGGGGDGAGIGLIALLAATGALGNNNNRRNDCERDCVTQADLNGKAIGDLKGEVKDAQAELQLGSARAEASINATTTATGNALQNGQTALLLQNANQTASLLAAVAAVDTNVDRQACETRVAIKETERNILEVINQNRIRDLEQQLTVAQLRESEGRQIIRENDNSHRQEITVTQIQNNNQLQIQEIRHSLALLSSGVAQVARATNSQVVVGSTGVVGGAQTANPNNVNI